MSDLKLGRVRKSPSEGPNHRRVTIRRRATIRRHATIRRLNVLGRGRIALRPR
jgi:acetyltransferase-like isoleucine patch superfamily enzyme